MGLYTKSFISTLVPCKIYKNKNNSPPWNTHEIIESINDRNAMFRQAKNSLNNNDIKVARRARNRTNQLIQFSKAEYIMEA